MMKRATVMTAFLFCGILALAGCRAFDSSYAASPEADLAAQVNYAVDKTSCKTPSGVKVTKSTSGVAGTTGWAASLDGNSVTISAAKKGDFSATITMKKVAEDKSTSTLSFTVKKSGDNKFSACDFKYSEGSNHTYEYVRGSVQVDLINAPSDNSNNVFNSGSFDLTFSHTPFAATATKVQSVYLGSADVSVLNSENSALVGSYFVDWLNDTSAQ